MHDKAGVLCVTVDPAKLRKNV